MILHQQTLDYNNHGKHSTGDYVLGHEEPTITNTNAPRAIDCIYLRYNAAHQGGHELMHLATGDVVTRRYVTPSPITSNIIRRVHALAELQKMPKGLKIQNKVGTMIYDSTWIAGVDYDPELDHEDMNDDDYIQNDDEEDDESEDEYIQDDDIDDQATSVENDNYNKNNDNNNVETPGVIQEEHQPEITGVAPDEIPGVHQEEKHIRTIFSVYLRCHDKH